MERSCQPGALFLRRGQWRLCHFVVPYAQRYLFHGQFTNGGLVTASPVGLTNNAANAAAIAAITGIGPQFATFGAGAPGAANLLKGTQFVGPSAQAVPFNFGVNNITPGVLGVVPFGDADTNGSNCYACSGQSGHGHVANYSPLTAVPYHKFNLFSYSSYKLTPDITASLMLNYGWNAEENQANNGRAQNYTIKADNAFIPTALQPADDRPGGIPSLTLGSAAIGNILNQQSNSRFRSTISEPGCWAEFRPELPPAVSRRLHPGGRLLAVRQ